MVCLKTAPITSGPSNEDRRQAEPLPEAVVQNMEKEQLCIEENLGRAVAWSSGLHTRLLSGRSAVQIPPTDSFSQRVFQEGRERSRDALASLPEK